MEEEGSRSERRYSFVCVYCRYSQGFLGKLGMDKRMKQPPPKIRTAPAATAQATDQEYSYSSGIDSSEVISHRTDCRKISRDTSTIKPGRREKEREEDDENYT
ncbi:hypothetical protein JD844_001481 [Phrynosoma platyrhinos]|uniref:Uncharacterized protein n=1 Tax=Phrynosoma platyrhinos TaxID=52577 RepID=A0ABQ7TAB8_PHRPL|nr:hypothetical protein JD844_001481 [Phrynosoma platyrhinos]